MYIIKELRWTYIMQRRKKILYNIRKMRKEFLKRLRRRRRERWSLAQENVVCFFVTHLNRVPSPRLEQRLIMGYKSPNWKHPFSCYLKFILFLLIPFFSLFYLDLLPFYFICLRRSEHLKKWVAILRNKI